MPLATRASETKKKILKAALRVFATKGWSGARVHEIAREAGVNKAMLYYHVGNKKALYGEVLASSAALVVAKLEGTLRHQQPGPARLRAMQQTLAQLFQQEPQLPRLLLRNLLESPRQLPPRALLGLAQIFAVTRRVLEEGVASGEFRPVNPFLAHLFAAGSLGLGVVALDFARESNLQSFLTPDLPIPSMEALPSLVSDILLHGLCLSAGG